MKSLKTCRKIFKWVKESGFVLDHTFKVPKGESFQDMKRRAGKFLKRLMKKEKNKNILIVTH